MDGPDNRKKRGIEGLCVNWGTEGKRGDKFGGGDSIQLDRQCVDITRRELSFFVYKVK